MHGKNLWDISMIIMDMDATADVIVDVMTVDVDATKI
jgi:hypothetical protein